MSTFVCPKCALKGDLKNTDLPSRNDYQSGRSFLICPRCMDAGRITYVKIRR